MKRWRITLRVIAIAVNAFFAFWLFASAAVWGPNDYVGGAIVAIPPLLAIVALCVARREGYMLAPWLLFGGRLLVWLDGRFPFVHFRVRKREHHVIDVSTMPERLYTKLKSVRSFDQLEVRGAGGTLLKVGQSPRADFFIANYYRVVGNVESLLILNRPTHVQAIAMLARSLFELAVDIKLVDAVPDGVRKAMAFSDSEKLRAAEKVVNAGADRHGHHAAFISANSARVNTERATLWPAKQGKQLKPPSHWSNLSLRDRAQLVSAELYQRYEVDYAQLSWYAHSGLTGFVGLAPEIYNHLAGQQLGLAAEFYAFVLKAVIGEFGIEKVDPKILKKLQLAELLPFAGEHADALKRELLG